MQLNTNSSSDVKATHGDPEQQEFHSMPLPGSCCTTSTMIDAA